MRTLIKSFCFWNLSFAPVAEVANRKGMEAFVFADDVNVMHLVTNSTSSDTVLEQLRDCQTSLHQWGTLQHVKVDPSRGHVCIVLRACAQGYDFKTAWRAFRLQAHHGIRG